MDNFLTESVKDSSTYKVLMIAANKKYGKDLTDKLELINLNVDGDTKDTISIEGVFKIHTTLLTTEEKRVLAEAHVATSEIANVEDTVKLLDDIDPVIVAIDTEFYKEK